MSLHSTVDATTWPPVDPPSPSFVMDSKPIELSPEQQEVLDTVKAGKNVFFTGAAGTGKSVLLREIVNWCRGRKILAVTASTGIASINIGGQTLHSWAGIGLGIWPAHHLAAKIIGVRDCMQTKKRMVGDMYVTRL